MSIGRVLAAVTAIVVGSVTAAVPAWGGAADERTVSYRGYRVTVPAAWPVVDLAAEPHACVRFDRPAVYLGQPGDEPWCPTDLVGRTAGLLIQPLDRVPADVAVTAAGRAAAGRLVSRDGAIQVAVRDAGVLVTAAHTQETEAAVRAILASATLGGDARPADPAEAVAAGARRRWRRPGRSPAPTPAAVSTPAPPRPSRR